MFIRLWVLLGAILPRIHSLCSVNALCYHGCYNYECDLDIQSHFYNSSIAWNSSGLHGPNCCSGCADGFFQKYQKSSSCTDECPALSNGTQTYAYLASKNCVLECPDELFADNNTLECQEICSNSAYGDSVTGMCYTVCPDHAPVHNHDLMTCQQEEIIEESTDQQGSSLGLIIGIASAAVLIFGTITFLSYRFYCRKRIIRKQWKYDYMEDIQFSLP